MSSYNFDLLTFRILFAFEFCERMLLHAFTVELKMGIFCELDASKKCAASSNGYFHYGECFWKLLLESKCIKTTSKSGVQIYHIEMINFCLRIGYAS